jgi:hypothetical protein
VVRFTTRNRTTPAAVTSITILDTPNVVTTILSNPKVPIVLATESKLLSGLGLVSSNST